MALDAGSVFAVLGGKFNPAGFAQFDATMKKSSATAAKSEAAMSGSFKRSGAAAAAMAATVAQSASKVQSLMISQQRATIGVERAQIAATAATSKFGASSLQARSATLALTAAQQRQAIVARDLAAAQTAHTAVQAHAARASSRTAGAMTMMGSAAKTGAAVGVVALGYALVKSVQSAAKFETKMSELQAVTKANTATMKQMSDAALDLGAKTGVGATEAAGALTELAKGGLDANTSIAALTGTIALAQAGDMELADAANTVVKSLSLFSLAGADAGHVADGLASAANATSMDVADFAQALAQGGSAAAAAGFSFDDTINIMASMADKFQSGSDLGTSLKTTLVQMANPSKKAADEMKRLGISLFQANGEIKPVASIVSMLGDRFKGMSDKQKLSTAATIAGTDGMRTLLALLGSSGKDIIVPGSAADIAAKKMDNFAGTMKKFKAELQTLGIEIGNALLPALTDLASGLTAVLQTMRGDFSAFSLSTLGDVRAIISTISTAASVMRLIPGPIGDLWAEIGDGAQNAIDGIDKSTNKIRNTNIKIKLTADLKMVKSELEWIQKSKIAPKVAVILANKEDADSKIKALIALGVPPKTAKILAESKSAKDAISDIRNRLAGLEDRTIKVKTVYEETGRLPKSGYRPTASGARAGTAQTALVGEGGGPEWIVNRETGAARMVTGAQLANLNENEYVIPTESKYRPQALGLLSMLAADLGVQGFAPGKAAKKKLAAAKKRKYAYQDGRIQSASDAATLYQTRMNTAETSGNATLYENNKKALADALKLELGRIISAVNLKGKLRPTGARLTMLKQNQADVEGLIAANLAAKFPAAADATTYSADEQKQLDELGRQLAMAELTTDDITDDQGVLAAKEKYLAGILTGAGMGAGRGGVTAVTQIAGDLKSTRDQLAGLTPTTPGITADQQAQADQTARNQTMAAQSAAIDRLVGATLGGSPTLVFQSYVPPSPTEARRLADYTVGGIGYQGGTQSSKDSVGI